VTALEKWQAQVRACRSERSESEEQVWQRLAQWYGDWARHNDYVSRVLPCLLACVGEQSRVLEIGPGSGAFAIRLARSVGEVVALEPSPNMRTVLEHNLANVGIGNVQILAQRAEDGLAELDDAFDLALASHSLYNIEPIDRVIGDLMRLARHVVFLMGVGAQSEWYHALHLRFCGKSPVPVASFCEFYPMLMEMGICADVEILMTRSNYVYDCEDSMLDWWQGHLGLDASRRDELRAALMGKAERRGNHIGIYGVNRSALMWIERERNQFSF